MHNKVLLSVLTLSILVVIITGGWFYIAGNRSLQTRGNQQTTATEEANVKDQTVTNGQSGVYGQVLTGPQCPLYQPDQPQCQDKPTQTEIIVMTQNRNQEIGRYKTDPDGNYKITLPAGTYFLKLSPLKTNLPSGMPQTVTIEADKFTELNLHYDSGIR